MTRRFLTCLRCLLWLCLAWASAPAAVAAADEAGLPPGARQVLVLDAARDAIDAWPAVAVLEDPEGQWRLADAVARARQFTVPQGPHANLGPKRHPVWLRVAVRSTGGPTQWVFDVDYPPLNRLELYLLRDGRIVQQLQMGTMVESPPGRPRLRTPGARLELAEPGDYELYLRVQTSSAMVLPMAFRPLAEFHARESRVQLVQGFMNGIALTLLVYSLAHWLSLGSRMFAYYALMMAGTASFFGLYFGVVQQHLGLSLDGALAKAAPMAILLGLVGGCRFVLHALDVGRDSPRCARRLEVLSWAAGLALAGAALGLLDYRLTQLAATVLGPPLMLLSVPVAWKRARAGDRAGGYMLLGWGTYLVGALSLAGLLRGVLPANEVTVHLFQWSWAAEMVAWLRVLGLRIEAVRRSAESAEAERRVLQALALTDPLTGLPNRRGLQAALAQAMPEARPEAALAVYLLDLDGFKPVNDRLGHDAGDRLLVQVGQRLQARLRHSDVVARLGGDEFVVMAPGLAGEAEARMLGQKLLAAFEQPFDLDGQTCKVGATIGFALAPHDGREGGDLLRRADAAMYAGKQAGRQTLRRGAASPGLAG